MGKAMLKAKTGPERLQDIVARSGLSPDIVRRVLDARAASAMDDLKAGRRVVDFGICSLVPVIGSQVGYDGLHNKVTVKCTVSPRILDTLNAIPDYKLDDNVEKQDGIMASSLESFS